MINKIFSLIPKKIRKPIRDFISGKTVEEVDVIYKIYSKESGKGKVMIDVGAHVGKVLFPFAKKDWTIYGFEPDPTNRAQLLKRTAGTQNINIDTRAVSNISGETVSFYTSVVSSGISGMIAFHETHQETAKVQTIRLSDFCAENKIKKVDFLKIDTEGFDLLVLKGFDWKNQSHPDYIVSEFEDKKTESLNYTFRDQIQFLESNGYKVIISEWYPIVEYGKRHVWKRFVTNHNLITDPAAWGNLLACKPENFKKMKQTARKYGKLEDT